MAQEGAGDSRQSKRFDPGAWRPQRARIPLSLARMAAKREGWVASRGEGVWSKSLPEAERSRVGPGDE